VALDLCEGLTFGFDFGFGLEAPREEDDAFAIALRGPADLASLGDLRNAILASLPAFWFSAIDRRNSRPEIHE